MRKVSFLSPLWLLSFLVLSSCGGHGGGTAGLSLLYSIAVTPAGSAGAQGSSPGIVISPGTSLHYIATGEYTDGTTQDITSEVAWSVNTPDATISNDPGYRGLLTALSTGSTSTIRVTATLDGITGSATLSINSPTSPARGNSWTIRSFGNSLLGIGLGVGSSGTQFVATGQGGIILTSPTGTLWTHQTSGTTEYLWDAASSGTKNVVVGSNGTILTSSTGTSWTPQTSGTSHYLWSVAWSGGTQFVAVGEAGTILTSADNGGSWTLNTSVTGTFSTNNLNGVTCDNSGNCVAAGQNNTLLYTSGGGGGIWQQGTLPSTMSSKYLWGVAYGTPYSIGTFVAVGSNGTILYSTNGTNWTKITSGTSLYLDRVTWSGSQFVAVGQDGIILTSPDGSTWTHQTSDTNQFLWGVAWSGTRFAAVGLNGVITSSPNGVTWTRTSSATTDNINSVAWSGTEFAAVGDGGTVLTSPTGSAWTLESSGTTTNLNGVAALGTTQGLQFVAVGNGGTIITSPIVSSPTWTTQTSGISNSLYGIASNWFPKQPLPGSPLYVAVGVGGTIITSTDGVNWATPAPPGSGTTNTLNGIAWSGTEFVAVGDSGTIITSSDNGATWQIPTFVPPALGTNNLNSIAWSGTEFVAAVADGSYLTAGSDGSTWTQTP